MIEMADGSPNIVGFFTSIAVDAQGNPDVSHYDVTASDLKYAESRPTPSSIDPLVFAVAGSAAAWAFTPARRLRRGGLRPSLTDVLESRRSSR